jgi:hypothetical protein
LEYSHVRGVYRQEVLRSVFVRNRLRRSLRTVMDEWLIRSFEFSDMTEKQLISGFSSSQDLSRLCCCLRFQRKSRYFSKVAMEMLHLSSNVLQLSFYMLIHYSISNDYDSHFALIVLSITTQMYLKVRNKTFHDI